MPMIDAYIPEGVLEQDHERRLIDKLTTTLLRWEGADPKDERVRNHVQSIIWVFLHRPKVFVGGDEMVSDAPRYKIVVSLPEGQFDRESRAGLVAEITNHVLDAEPSGRDRNPFRVWVFCNEIPEGAWGSGGRIFGLADISSFVFGDNEAGRAHAKKRLAAARAERQAVTVESGTA